MKFAKQKLFGGRHILSFSTRSTFSHWQDRHVIETRIHAGGHFQNVQVILIEKFLQKRPATLSAKVWGRIQQDLILPSNRRLWRFSSIILAKHTKHISKHWKTQPFLHRTLFPMNGLQKTKSCRGKWQHYTLAGISEIVYLWWMRFTCIKPFNVHNVRGYVHKPTVAHGVGGQLA